MSVVGDFNIPVNAFALDEALSTVPEMTIEADRLASHSPKEVFPFLWGSGGDFDRFLHALEDDPTVTSADIAGETDEEVLYRLEWSESVRERVHEMIDHHAALLRRRPPTTTGLFNYGLPTRRWSHRSRATSEKRGIPSRSNTSLTHPNPANAGSA